MKISVKNFGPIREAKDIRIAPLTLFVGPSNRGKSYLVKATSAAIESVRYAAGPVLYKEDDERNLNFITKNSLGKEEKELEMEKRFSQWAEDVRREWKERAGFFFDKQGENIAQNKNVSAMVSSNDGDMFVDFSKSQGQKIKKEWLSGMVKMAESALKNPSNSNGKKKQAQIFAQGKINERFFSSVCDNLSLKICYLPASRGGIMQSYRTITDKMLRPMPVSEDKNDLRIISGMLGRFAQQLTEIEKKENGGSEVKAINENLERKILSGRIDVKFPGAESKDFRYVMEGKKDELTMNDVSAAVAELAPLSVFMRYCLKRNDLLIFEEPETGLHPEGQRDIADIMVRLANAGVFVLATTHSDTILEQIGNAIRASQFNNAAKGKKLLGKNRQPLALENSAVYDFNKRSKSGGTIVKEVSFAPVTGVLTKDHMKVAHELYDQTVDLVNSRNDELA